jgi:hypothetical protein
MKLTRFRNRVNACAGIEATVGCTVIASHLSAVYDPRSGVLSTRWRTHFCHNPTYKPL